MIDTNISTFRMEGSRMVDLHSTVARVEEGTLLQLVLENGREVALPTTGANTEKIGGFAIGTASTPSKAARYEDLVVPASSPYTITLANTPTSGSLTLRVVGGAALTVDAAPAAGKYSLAGRVLTFDAAQAGAALRAVYEYSPTLVEVQMLYGQSLVEDPQGMLGRVGMVFYADALFFSNFDTSSDWWNANPGAVCSAANGKVTKSTGGVLLANCSVVAAPNATSPLLGLRVNL